MNKKIRNSLILVAALALTGGTMWYTGMFDKKIASNTPAIFTEGETQMVARTHGKQMQVYRGGEWHDFFVKGVNMGMALPGTWFTKFPKDVGLYTKWFDQIGQMNANTIRVYTLMDPTFYIALKQYNEKHPDAPLMLLQEIWPEEHPEGNNYLKKEYLAHNEEEAKNVIDALHGNASIAPREGRAFGVYETDVSPYLLGYLIGRELEPEEVISTNEQNPGYTFAGDYMKLKENASPAEGWLAWHCDYVLAYEEQTYKWQHPVSIVSWPTLDPMEHDSEWNKDGLKSEEYNDRVSLDIKNFLLGSKMKAGFFGSYHIYPNYPDFMNNEQKYDQYQDEQGRLRYGGYLQEFIAEHGDYPALVAEFGLATGMGNAHTSPDGYNHGGMTEEQQGAGIVRMMKAIEREGYMGGVIFEWIDEWAKKTWTTEPYMIPYERKVLWHNGIDPEQNYGILAMESVKPEQPSYKLEDDGLIKKLEMSTDETYLYMDFHLQAEAAIEDKEWLVGIDTYARDRGEFRYQSGLDVAAPSGMEFLIQLSNTNGSRLLTTHSYNIGNMKFASQKSESGNFEEIRYMLNEQRVRKDGSLINADYEQSSALYQGDFVGSRNNWYREKDIVHIRIPWGRLNVTDPSSLVVLDDPRSYAKYPGRDTFSTVKTEGLVVTSLFLDKTGRVVDHFPGSAKVTLPPVFTWKGWDDPKYQERPKRSYSIIQEYFKTLP